MSVDFPAPFSPTMPWIEPRAMESSISLLACTGPKDFEMLESWMAGAVVFMNRA